VERQAPVAKYATVQMKGGRRIGDPFACDYAATAVKKTKCPVSRHKET